MEFLTRTLVTALCYFGLARFMVLASIDGYSTMYWPAAGLSMALAVIWGRPALLGTVIGSAINNVATAVTSGAAVPFAAGVGMLIGYGAAVQAAVGAYLLRGRVVSWRNLPTYLGLMALACLVNASVGPAILGTFGLIDRPFLSTAWTWWLGDFAGCAILGTLMLAVYR